MTTSLSRGMLNVRFFKLCSRAPPILINSLLTNFLLGARAQHSLFCGPTRKFVGFTVSDVHFPLKSGEYLRHFQPGSAWRKGKEIPQKPPRLAHALRFKANRRPGRGATPGGRGGARRPYDACRC